MKVLLIFIFALAAAVWIGLSLHHQQGAMIITLAGWRVDFPLWLGVLALIMVYLVLHYTLRLLTGLFNVRYFLKNVLQVFRKQQAKKATQKGLVALAEGKWGQAERLLIKGANNDELPWLNYFSAAKAAQELGKDEKRDTYLRLAQETIPESDIAISLTQAQLQYQHKQYTKSLATLNDLRNKVPHHPYGLKLLQEVYYQLKQWELLWEVIPKLKKYRILPEDDLVNLERTVLCELLLAEQKNQSLKGLEALWQKIPKVQRLDGDIAYIYAKALMQHAKAIEAESVIRAALKHEWREDLARVYGHLWHPTPQKLITTAEGWLEQHPNSPGLLLTLGRLCEQQQLWGKAQRYLEASLSLAPHPETYAEMGALFEKMNKPEQGAQYFKKGLLLASPVVKQARVIPYIDEP